MSASGPVPNWPSSSSPPPPPSAVFSPLPRRLSSETAVGQMLAGHEPTPEECRRQRAVHVLEGVGNSDAHALLEGGSR